MQYKSATLLRQLRYVLLVMSTPIFAIASIKACPPSGFCRENSANVSRILSSSFGAAPTPPGCFARTASGGGGGVVVHAIAGGWWRMAMGVAAAFLPRAAV